MAIPRGPRACWAWPWPSTCARAATSRVHWSPLPTAASPRRGSWWRSARPSRSSRIAGAGSTVHRARASRRGGRRWWARWPRRAPGQQERLNDAKTGNTAWVRASDHSREQTVAALRERALDGCLTLDTFAQRVEAAYRAKTEDELADLVADLPGSGRTLLERGRDALSQMWRRPEPPPPALEIEVLLPRDADAVTVGRSHDCDVVV